MTLLCTMDPTRINGALRTLEMVVYCGMIVNVRL